MNQHPDCYFEWMGKQNYEYKSELRRLESIQAGLLSSPVRNFIEYGTNYRF